MKNFDEEIGSWCESNQITYTRYSDDMTFSSDFNPSEVIIKVRKLLYKLGLELNYSKIHIVHQNSRQLITGIVVNEKAQVCSKYRKEIRKEVYYINKFGLSSHIERSKSTINSKKYLEKLYGRILYVLQIDKDNTEFLKYKNIIKELL